MTVTVRFAPSPTGNIHIGNARTALFNWLFAMKNSGNFVQRFDDTDVARSKQEYADAILYDLHWLGIFQDATEYQSRRFDIYEDAVARLKATGCSTPATRRRRNWTSGARCAVREACRRSTAARRCSSPSADRGIRGGRAQAALALPAAELPQRAVRDRAHRGHWTDLVRGEETVDLASLSDPILMREDGTYLYTLPSVVDDIDMGITHVIRGDDHVTNTGVQIALFKALGAEPPEFGHHNLLTTVDRRGRCRSAPARCRSPACAKPGSSRWRSRRWRC